VKEISMTLKTQCLIGLSGLALVDIIIPIPILGIILIFVVIQKPTWFQNLAEMIYTENSFLGMKIWAFSSRCAEI
jgi:hypothetical protein